MLIGAGAAGEGPQDGANELKAALARRVPCVGRPPTTSSERHIQGDPALERRFVPVLVREPFRPPTRPRILRARRRSTRPHHQVSFLPDALEAAAHLSARYVPRPLPADKAFAASIWPAPARVAKGTRKLARRRGACGREDGRLPEERLLQPDGERFLNLEHRPCRTVVDTSASSRLWRARTAPTTPVRRPRPAGVVPLSAGRPEWERPRTAPPLADELCDGRLVAHQFYPTYATAPPPAGGRRPPGTAGTAKAASSRRRWRRPACVVLLDEAEKAHLASSAAAPGPDEGQLTEARAADRFLRRGGDPYQQRSAKARFAGEPRGRWALRSRTTPRWRRPQPPQADESPAAEALELARGTFPPSCGPARPRS